MRNKYQRGTERMPILLANSAPRARVPSTAYVPPPLQENGVGWYPEFNKVWEWFGMPVSESESVVCVRSLCFAAFRFFCVFVLARVVCGAAAAAAAAI